MLLVVARLYSIQAAAPSSFWRSRRASSFSRCRASNWLRHVDQRLHSQKFPPFGVLAPGSRLSEYVFQELVWDRE